MRLWLKLTAIAMVCGMLSVGAAYADAHAEGATIILQHTSGDVTGDGQPDSLLLIGKQAYPDNSEFMQQLTLIMEDDTNGRFVQIAVGEDDTGYDPQLRLLDANGDGVDDVFVSAATGGSGGISTYSLVTFRDDEAKPLVPQDVLNRAPQFDVVFKDGFLADITDQRTGATTPVDIRHGEETYLQLGIYDAQSTLLKPTRGWADGYSMLTPERQSGGGYVFVGTQRVAGAAHVDTIATVRTRWSFADGEWTLLDQTVAGIDWDNMPSSRYPVNSVFAPQDDEQAVLENADGGSLFVLDAKYADVTDDGIPDDVLLVGRKEHAGDTRATGIRVAVRDGNSGGYMLQSIGEQDQGFEPKLFIGQFSAYGGKDVFVQAATGGSGGTSIYSLLTFRNGEGAAVIEQAKLTQGIRYDVEFDAGFTASIWNSSTGSGEALDVGARKADYIRLGIYDADGSLLKPYQGMVDSFSQLLPVDIDHDGVYELRGLQRISGAYHADVIAEAESVWSVDGASLSLTSDHITPVGNVKQKDEQ